MQWLTSSNSSSIASINDPALFLGVPDEYAPPQECFLEGLQSFKEKYPDLGDRRHPMRKIQSLGARLWAERLERLALEAEKKGREVEEPDDEEEAPAQTEESRVWEPDMVLRGLEFVLRHGTFHMRRARWLCALSESSLCWDVGNASAESAAAICVQISEGRIVSRQTLLNVHESPVPLGYPKPLSHKQQCFDRATYDRLRILTTELRRLIASNRPLSLRLSPNAALQQLQLTKMLPWV